ncbi:hypothetical protein P4S72_02895 [Vibrio sp. PP-XX7]
MSSQLDSVVFHLMRKIFQGHTAQWQQALPELTSLICGVKGGFGSARHRAGTIDGCCGEHQGNLGGFIGPTGKTGTLFADKESMINVGALFI